MTLEPLKLNLHGVGLRDELPLAADDYAIAMESIVVDGEEALSIQTHAGRTFHARANDAGGLDVQEVSL